MQMRLAGIAGSADTRQYLAAPHAVSCVHEHTFRLQMHVMCKLALARVKVDCVSRYPCSTCPVLWIRLVAIATIMAPTSVSAHSGVSRPSARPPPQTNSTSDTKSALACGNRHKTSVLTILFQPQPISGRTLPRVSLLQRSLATPQ